MDSGANIHISNCTNTVINTRPPGAFVDQVNGIGVPAEAIGDWTFWLGNRFVHSRHTFLMPKNPTSTLGSAALKLQNGYTRTTHDQFEFASYVHKDGSSFTFTKKNKLLRTINALHYAPLIFYMNKLPDNVQPICHQVQLRRTQRIRKMTSKMADFVQSQKKNIPDDINISPSTTPKNSSSSPPNQPLPSKTLPPTEDTNTSSKHNQHVAIQTDSDHHVHGHLSSLIVHLKFGCRNHKSLRHMHTTKAIENMPTISLPKLPCPICLLVKNTRLTKNRETHMGPFKPGQLMMMDYAYFSATSIRGYVAYFSITCQATGYGFVFPVPNKRPPLSLITWIAKCMQRQGRPISFARFDEGGELARSQQICQLLISLNIVMQSTGGYASNLLGKDERQHRTLAEIVTTMLYTANLSTKYWCFAILYAIYIKRRWCNYPDSVTPFQKWF